jgi:hypothetical protein
VATSLTYIEEGGFLSRKDVEDQGLYQTPQKSDNKDKDLDVFGDIFFDTVDLHKHFRRQNHYGPVLFRLDLDFLLDDRLEVWVTKENPVHWSISADNSTNYFHSVEELDFDWGKYERHKKMVTIRKPGRVLPFNCLRELNLDDPILSISDNVDLGEVSLFALNDAVKKLGLLEDGVAVRQCNSCFCRDNYQKQIGLSELIQKFLPKRVGS